MRTTKRFTPKVLERFQREGRGTGLYADYKPWHKVSRSDPSSNGRSHLINWRSRLRELLSDGELGCQHFVAMLSDLEDCLEQYPLDYQDGPHLLTEYGQGSPLSSYPGTQTLVKELGIRHPVTTEKGRSAPWRPSTDFVLVRRRDNEELFLVAIAFKPSNEIRTRRARELLSIEREYWVRRGASWLLLTPNLFHYYVDQNLKCTAPWGILGRATTHEQAAAANIARENPWASYSRIIELISAQLSPGVDAPDAFWKAVWSAKLPIDLRIAFHPMLPLKYLSTEEFMALNPIHASRSSWI